jgi:CRISPR-associated protein Csm2
MAINLDYKTNQELFNTVAENYANKIGDGVKNTQIRKFYDYVLEYAEKSRNITNDEFKSDILPFIKMLNSKVAYASTRSSGGGKLVNEAFVNMIKDCVSAVQEKEDLTNFKLFFEAVIGFHKSLEGKDKGAKR